MQVSCGAELTQYLVNYTPKRVGDGSSVITLLFDRGWKQGKKEKDGFVDHNHSKKGYVTVISDHCIYSEV